MPCTQKKRKKGRMYCRAKNLGPMTDLWTIQRSVNMSASVRAPCMPGQHSPPSLFPSLLVVICCNHIDPSFSIVDSCVYYCTRPIHLGYSTLPPDLTRQNLQTRSRDSKCLERKRLVQGHGRAPAKNSESLLFQRWQR